ncbi:MAG: hypothetical protein ACI36Y_08770 [Coriobacteriales bacterium]
MDAGRIDYERAFRSLMVYHGGFDRVEDEALRMSTYNRELLEMSGTCGCYSCGAVMDPGEVVDFTDGGETGICPFCRVDALVPSEARVPVDGNFIAAFLACKPEVMAIREEMLASLRGCYVGGDAGEDRGIAQVLDITPRAVRPLGSGEAYCCVVHHPPAASGVEQCAEVVANCIRTGELTAYADDVHPVSSELFLAFEEDGGRYRVNCGIDCDGQMFLLRDGEPCRLELSEHGEREAWTFALSAEPIDPARMLNRMLHAEEPAGAATDDRALLDAAEEASRGCLDGSMHPEGCASAGPADRTAGADFTQALHAPRTLADYVRRAVVRELLGQESDVDLLVMEALEGDEPLDIRSVLMWEWLAG